MGQEAQNWGPIVLTADGTNSLYSTEYGEMYHCWGGAKKKATKLFLENSGILEPRDEKTIRILEIGFGTGLNFFMTADALLSERRSLEYTGVEKNLVDCATVEALGYRSLVKNVGLVDGYLRCCARKTATSGPKQVTFDAAKKITLRLVLNDAKNVTFDSNCYDAVYFDPFSPDKNHDLWEEGFLEGMFACLRSGGHFCSYCVKGEVRRVLKRIGFDVKKVPGILGKREVLIATKH